MKKLIAVIGAVVLAASVGMYGAFSYSESVLRDDYVIRKQASDTIAIVSLDDGVEINGNKTYYGNVFIDLLGNDPAYVVESASGASAGLADGRYGAVITFPANTSQCIASLDSANPVQLSISYAVGQNLDNQVYVKVISKISSFQNQINDNVSYLYVSSILGGLHDAQNLSGELLSNNEEVLVLLESLELMDYVDSLELGAVPTLDFQPEGLQIDTYLNEANRYADDISRYYTDSYRLAQNDFNQLHNEMVEARDDLRSQTQAYTVELNAWRDASNAQNLAVSDYNLYLNGIATDLQTRANMLSDEVSDFNAYVTEVGNWYSEVNTWRSQMEASRIRMLANENAVTNNINGFTSTASGINSQLQANHNYLSAYIEQLSNEYQTLTEAISSYIDASEGLNDAVEAYNSYLESNNNASVIPGDGPAISDEHEQSGEFVDTEEPNTSEQNNASDGNEELGLASVGECYENNTAQTQSDRQSYLDAINTASNNYETAYQELLDAVGQLQNTIETFNSNYTDVSINSLNGYIDNINNLWAAISGDLNTSVPEFTGRDSSFLSNYFFVYQAPTINAAPTYTLQSAPELPDEILIDADRLASLTDSYDPTNYLSDDVNALIAARYSRFSEYSRGVEGMMNAAYERNISRMQSVVDGYNNYVNTMRNNAIRTYNEEQEAFRASVEAYADSVRSINEENIALIGEFTEVLPNTRLGDDINTGVVNAIIQPVEFVDQSQLMATESTTFADAKKPLPFVMAGSALVTAVFGALSIVDKIRKRRA